MCQMMMENGAFDPALCPLLQNLSPEEIAERLQEPRFKACVARVERGGPTSASKDTGCAERPACLEAA